MGRKIVKKKNKRVLSIFATTRTPLLIINLLFCVTLFIEPIQKEWNRG